MQCATKPTFISHTWFEKRALTHDEIVYAFALFTQKDFICNCQVFPPSSWGGEEKNLQKINAIK